MHRRVDSPPIVIFTIGLFRFFILSGFILLIYFQVWLPAIVLFFLLVITQVCLVWSSLGLRKLIIVRNLMTNRIFPGEKLKLKLNISNNKLLPAILEWQQPLLADFLVINSAKLNNKKIYPDEKTITINMAIKSYSKEIYELELQGLKRGYFNLPSAQVISRDGLGLYANQFTDNQEQWVIVYPRLIPMEELTFKPTDIIGDRRDLRPILPDPIRISGLREYTQDLSARLIHWKASAHKDQLLAKTLEPSANHKILLTIDVEDFIEEKVLTEDFETAVSIAASLAVWADEQRIPFGLIANGSQKNLPGPVSIPISGNILQASLVLERLARLEFNSTGKLADLLDLEGEDLPWGTTLIHIGYKYPTKIPSGVSNVVHYTSFLPSGEVAN